MTRLLVSTADLLLRRLTHTASYPRARLPTYLGLLAAGLAASGWFTLRNHADMAGLPSTERMFAAVIAVAVSYVIAGPVVLTAELARDKSGRLEAALASLPLTRRSVHVLVWGPVLALIALMLALLFPPTIATLLGAGLPLVDAVSYAGVSLALGGGTAALSVLLVSLALSAEKWNVVRAPVCFLIWAGIVVLQVLAAVDVLTGKDVPLRDWLLFPRVLDDVSQGAGLNPVTAIASIGVSTIVALCLLLLTGERVKTGSHGRITVPWTNRLRRNRPVGELLYALRDANILANFVTCVLLGWGALSLAHQLPHRVHPQVMPLAMMFILLCAGIPSRSLRGAFPSRLTAQQATGMTVGSWFVSQNVVSIVLFVLVGVPATLLPGMTSPQDAILLLSLALSAFACSVVSGWAVVVRNENSLGQVLVTLIYLTVGAIVTGIVVDLWKGSPMIALGLATVLWAAGSAGSLALERARWRYRAA